MRSVHMQKMVNHIFMTDEMSLALSHKQRLCVFVLHSPDIEQRQWSCCCRGAFFRLCHSSCFVSSIFHYIFFFCRLLFTFFFSLSFSLCVLLLLYHQVPLSDMISFVLSLSYPFWVQCTLNEFVMVVVSLLPLPLFYLPFVLFTLFHRNTLTSLPLSLFLVSTSKRLHLFFFHSAQTHHFTFLLYYVSKSVCEYCQNINFEQRVNEEKNYNKWRVFCVFVLFSLALFALR